MSSIGGIAKSIVWDNKELIGTAAVAIPVAVEGARLAKNIYKRPNFLKEKAVEIKNWTIRSFTPSMEETNNQAIRRISKNIFKLVACLALMTGVAYASLVFLPSAMAIPVALAAIVYIGKASLAAGAFFKKFKVQAGEDPTAARKRITKLIIKTVLIAATTAAAIAIGAYIISPLFTTGFTWSLSIPFQTKAVVFLEYALIGAVHLGLAARSYQKGDKKKALFHLFAGAMGFIFPMFYWNNQMRLHHSIFGLIFMALPFRPIQFIGSLITLDSSLYMFSAARGGYAAGTFHSYDFMNVVVDKFPLFCQGYSAALIGQAVNDEWERPSKKEKAVENLAKIKRPVRHIQRPERNRVVHSSSCIQSAHLRVRA